MLANRRWAHWAVLNALCACVPASQPFADRGQWQAISLDDNRIGHRQLLRQRQGNTLVSTEILRLKLAQPGAALSESETRLIYRESQEGQPLGVEKVLSSNSANSRMVAEVRDDTLAFHPEGDPSPRSQTFPLPDRLLFPEGIRLALASQSGDSRRLRYQSWSFSEQGFTEYQLQAMRLSEADRITLQGPQAAQYAWKVERRQLGSGDNRTTILYSDPDFFPLAEHSESGGRPFQIVTCSQSCALTDFVPETHVYRQLIPSPYRISDTALQGKIRYRLKGDFTLQPPTTFEQQATPISEGWDLTVCGDCGDEARPSEADLQAALASNYWLAADEAIFKALVAEQIPESGDARGKMKRLTRLVTRHMSEVAEYAGYATALEAWHNRTGDCTEHALLLATLGKAAGIPTRVVLGLAYNNERFLGRRFVFVPHAWVQAWTGQGWESFDSGLGNFTAGYIALGLSQGEPATLLDINEQLHRIKVESAVQLKSR